MTHTVRIESAQRLPAADLVLALSAGGVEGVVVETSPCLRLRVLADDVATLASQVGHALDTLIADRRLALVPERVGDSAFVLRPPAA